MEIFTSFNPLSNPGSGAGIIPISQIRSQIRRDSVAVLKRWIRKWSVCHCVAASTGQEGTTTEGEGPMQTEWQVQESKLFTD